MIPAGATHGSESRQGYRSDIDGLRGVAVLSVVLYHLGIDAVPGGFLGVDIFFVISGYLITRIVQEEIQRGQFSIVRFYERRARRILPALLAVLATVLVVGLVLLPPVALEELSLSSLSTIFFSSNIYFWRSIGYFSTDAELWPLLHTWSLAVEEQFYIAYPLLLILLARKSFAIRLSAVLLLALGSFAFCIWLVDRSASATFYLLPTRGWELALGGMVALWELGSRRSIDELLSARIRSVLVLVSAAAILYSILGYRTGTPVPGWWTAMPVVGCSIIIACGRGTLIERALSLKWLVLVGLISYSLYLWHWPVLSLLRNVLGQVELGQGAAVLGAIVSFALAVLSWKYIEAPFRHRDAMSVTRVARLCGGAVAAIVVTSASAVLMHGIPGRLSEAERVAVNAMGDFRGNESCDAEPGTSGPCPIGLRSGPPVFIVWGDSHAIALKPGFDEVLLRRQVPGGIFALGGCPPLIGIKRQGVDYSRCAAANARALAWIAGNAASIEHVVLVGRWNLIATGSRPAGEGGGAAVFVSADGADAASQERVFEAALRTTVSALRERGVRVTVLDTLPEIGWNVPLATYYHLRTGVSPRVAPTLEQIALRGRAASAVIGGLSPELGFDFISVNERLCTPSCVVVDDGLPVYADEDHLSRHGARAVFGPAFEALVYPSPR